MKNKLKLKKCLIKTFILSVGILLIFATMNIYEYHTYRRDFNNKITLLVNALQNKYPELTETEIIEILNNDNYKEDQILKKYGIDIEKQSIISNNDNNYLLFLILNISFIIISIILLVLIFIKYDKTKDKDIKDITKYIEEINKKNYKLNIDSISEDELSILKNEIYKTTIMLREVADNSVNDKLSLKKSLEDISHQIKTPLTSILIMLDNLIDDYDMDNEIREEFIRDIKREVLNINFLVQAILKLSKFDSNTIHFNIEENSLRKIVDESIKNISTLCDLRNINIKTNISDEAIIKCDFKWQIEALSNILKNCIEHSNDNSYIEITIEDNKVYSQIIIKDYGTGIDSNDLPHIFERFYKSKNSKKDSIGIGLSLAKAIIEADNGNISVESNKNGTKFIIKYFK